MLLLLFIVKMLVKLWIEDPLSSGSSASIMQCYLFMKWKTLYYFVYIFFTNENGSLTKTPHKYIRVPE